MFDDTNKANNIPFGFTDNKENKKEELENTDKKGRLKPSSDEFIKTFQEYRDDPMKIYQLLFQ